MKSGRRSVLFIIGILSFVLTLHSHAAWAQACNRCQATCLSTNGNACSTPGNPSLNPTVSGSTPSVASADPNGKMSVGYGDQGFIPPNATLTYTIYFENLENATAPAQRVVVTDPLDANLDWSTVQLSQIGFNNVTLTVPGGGAPWQGMTTPHPESFGL